MTARLSRLARGSLVFASFAAGGLAWLAIAISASLAMGSTTHAAIATALATGGAAAVLGSALGVLGLRYAASAAPVEIGSTLALFVNLAAGVLALVFALMFHW